MNFNQHHRHPVLRRLTWAVALVAAFAGTSSTSGRAEKSVFTKFWYPWFFDLGGGTPGPGAPFLELSGKLRPGTTLCCQCWGLQPTDDVRLVIGDSLDLLSGPSGSVLVPHPDLILDVPVRSYDDDGPAGPQQGYAMMEFAVPLGHIVTAGPGACFQVWIKQGPDEWTASNAVGASFDIAKQFGH